MARILLIDDDDSVRSCLRLTLGQLGHTVIEARNGAEGLKLFASAQPDLVITDIVMPEKDGLEVLMTLRKEGLPAKVIAISGDRGKLTATESLRLAQFLGASKVLEKPFTREALTLAVNEILRSHRPLPPLAPATATGERRTDAILAGA